MASTADSRIWGWPVLPLELRRNIYVYVLVSAGVSFSIERASSRSILKRDLSPHVILPEKGSLLYSCSNLLLMSRGIRHEVIEMARSLAAKGQLDWALDISVSPHLPREQDMRLQWSRLPAPPSVYVQPGDRTNSADLITSGDVDQSEGETLSRGLNLVVRLVMEKGTEVRWIGDGGPGTFAQQLLTALGCWCENGLLFLEPRQEENKAKIYLANLTVVFVPAFPNEPVTREDLVAVLGEDHARIRAKPQTRDFSQLKSFLHWTAETGLLHGYMKNVHLAIENRGVQKSWTIKRNHEATRKEIAQEWAGYGWLPGQKYRLSRPCPGDRTVERLPRSQRNFINGQARWRLPGCTMS